MRTKKPWLTLLALLAALSLIAAACGDDEDSSSDDTSTETTAAADEGSDTTAADEGSDTTEADDSGDMMEPVGEACSQIPADGAGSSAGMAEDPVATAASNNPLLSTLVAAVTAADLGDALNDTSAEYTVFAPINSAFEALPEGTVESLTTDPAQMETLVNILQQHVVADGKMTIDDLIAAGEVEALNGGTDTIEAAGETFTVVGGSGDPATVVCGNVETANATVHLIDAVLMPAEG
ncbi:fasciclin domain-containing protein [Iamia majanohamensis]|uniref:Fasciclin domain-containing protein n=1 Tax=Iamia majanohamensis TaxID=467976 RepID=A0AAE9Y6V8_9ACTN|nr:fasciclin domain-containing protein [Iamia majanohamensis]WCO67647.1 fasciclin domain-containing protein [Iamia majanohamensis]